MLQQWADYLDRLRQERASSEHESITPVEKADEMSMLTAKPKAARVFTVSTENVPRMEEATAQSKPHGSRH
jgi:hypothetical protein